MLGTKKLLNHSINNLNFMKGLETQECSLRLEMMKYLEDIQCFHFGKFYTSYSTGITGSYCCLFVRR